MLPALAVAGIVTLLLANERRYTANDLLVGYIAGLQLRVVRSTAGGVRWSLSGWEGLSDGAADTVGDAVRDVLEHVLPFDIEGDGRVSVRGLSGGEIDSFASATMQRDGRWRWQAAPPGGDLASGIVGTRAAAVTAALHAMGVW